MLLEGDKIMPTANGTSHLAPQSRELTTESIDPENRPSNDDDAGQRHTTRFGVPSLTVG